MRELAEITCKRCKKRAKRYQPAIYCMPCAEEVVRERGKNRSRLTIKKLNLIKNTLYDILELKTVIAIRMKIKELLKKIE